MKKWFICLAISTLISSSGLMYFIISSDRNRCLSSGDFWLGLIQGCSDGHVYSIDSLVSPLAIAIFCGIVLGITSAIIQVYSISSKLLNVIR
ncbi:MAG: hypothetical protein ACI93R_004129 [Flavobacteriales bacterium]|jgi:hypothetical protein